jgi:plastocyanin
MQRRLICVTVAVLFAAACGGSEPTPATQAGPAADAQRVDQATAATLTGRVAFEGTPPVNPPVRMSSDPKCMKANADGSLRFENYVVADGGLDNVFVYVKDGLGNYHFDTPAEPAKIDQQGCRYVPHVLGVRAGQPVEITNNDATPHNVHVLPDVNGEMNFAQYQQGQTDMKMFTAPEVMVPIKCDLHPWMQAWVYVEEHPWFAVSDAAGAFSIPDVPPGDYTVEAVHEKYGSTRGKVTVESGRSTGFTLSFSAD